MTITGTLTGKDDPREFFRTKAAASGDIEKTPRLREAPFRRRRRHGRPLVVGHAEMYLTYTLR
ncbi:hypothetical protein PISMIDRAFT_682541 [Pisolithus microcarpus 441]|uniref:Unplaced genomic scaffold scaffold_87, whole genome shotgun sequence n=1 Tax=Pisolithus microcarpus 441 TaxID=765257 RepID=A0A0C9ZCJ2_9AGAM|nr:hypothetical protein PISMIDRAFT_682541 [Pisolithus microcarpus 441]